MRPLVSFAPASQSKSTTRRRESLATVEREQKLERHLEEGTTLKELQRQANSCLTRGAASQKLQRSLDGGSLYDAAQSVLEIGIFFYHFTN